MKMDDPLFRANPTAAEPRLIAPRGLAEIIASFGDIYKYIQPGGSLDRRWQTDQLASVILPFPLQLSWDHSQSVSRMMCHKRLAATLSAVFEEIHARGLQSKVASLGGCFAFRPQRTGAKLSAHCWGIAIDLNPETNPQGSTGNMDPAVIEVFRSAGFEWGGDWPQRTRDPMHFQFCSGY
jgi:D-alanyl-D-alanine carboxypeptidase